MKTPAFWQSKNTLSNVLLPLSVLYDMGGTLHRAFTKPVVLPIPVICVGNVTSGGSGKTPVALFIGQKLKSKNINAFFLTRGYGGSEQGPLLVKPGHTAQQVGDEPLLLSQLLPTVVCKDRVKGADYALAQGAEVIIMDDGFQNPSLAKTLSLVVVDGMTGFGNGRMLPAGPLRELPASGFARAQAVVVINPGSAMPALPAGKTVLTAITKPHAPLMLKGQKLLAFCGIAYPQKFFSMLATLGATLADSISYPDHYQYRQSDIDSLIAKARASQATLATTAKDAVRLPQALREKIAVVDISLIFENEAMLDVLLDNALKAYAKN